MARLRPDQNQHIVPVTYSASFDASTPAAVNATVGDALECGELCRHSFGRGNSDGRGAGTEQTIGLFKMEDLFPAKGKLVERNLRDGKQLGEVMRALNAVCLRVRGGNDMDAVACGECVR